ncbi:MAG: hypothetical protein ABFS10_08280 [Bacteroidota bacterium]
MKKLSLILMLVGILSFSCEKENDPESSNNLAFADLISLMGSSPDQVLKEAPGTFMADNLETEERRIAFQFTPENLDIESEFQLLFVFSRDSLSQIFIQNDEEFTNQEFVYQLSMLAAEEDWYSLELHKLVYYVMGISFGEVEYFSSANQMWSFFTMTPVSIGEIEELNSQWSGQGYTLGINYKNGVSMFNPEASGHRGYVVIMPDAFK